MGARGTASRGLRRGTTPATTRSRLPNSATGGEQSSFLFLLRFFGFAIERSSIDTIREKKAREIGCVIVFLQSVDLNVRFILLFYFIVNTLVIYVIFFIIRGKVYMVIKIILQGDMV